MRANETPYLATIYILVLCNTGCLQNGYRTQMRSVPNVTDADKMQDFMIWTKYLKNCISQIETRTKQGDTKLARDYLMTRKLYEEYSGWSAQWHQCLGETNDQFTVFYFLTAVNTLPQTGDAKVIELLCEYYYGKVCESTPTIDNRSVESTVSQLILGPYVDPKCRKLDGEIRVEKVPEKESDSLCVYRVTYKHLDKAYVWLLQFRQYEVRGIQVWLPERWGSGGHF